MTNTDNQNHFTADLQQTYVKCVPGINSKTQNAKRRKTKRTERLEDSARKASANQLVGLLMFGQKLPSDL
jgi:hypothetical protein